MHIKVYNLTHTVLEFTTFRQLGVDVRPIEMESSALYDACRADQTDTRT